VSYEEGKGVVTVDDAVSEESLIEAIERVGPYSGTIKKPDELN
jgi:hypothetical protein